jgi:tetratricopeptide (TPR) repeat protein
MEHGHVAEALDLAGSLRWAPFNTGHLYREHRAWIEAALAAARDIDTDRCTLGRGLVAAGAVAGLENRSTDAIGLLSEALDILTQLDASSEIVWCHMWLGAFHVDLGDYEAGVEHTRAGLELARASTSPTELVYLANQHAENVAAATILHDPGHFDEAQATYQLAIAQATEHGIEEGLARAQHGLAVLRARDDAPGSFDSCVDTVSEWRHLGHGNRLIVSLVSASRIAVLAGQPAASVDMQNEALDVIGTVGWNQPLGRLLETAAVTAAMAGNTTDAAFLAGAASNRFLTPRWFVDIAARDHFTTARSIDAEAWDLAAAAGAASTDDEAIDIVRRQRAGSPAPDPRSQRSRIHS